MVLFWQTSALDLESININFYFTSSICWIFFYYCCIFVFDDFCHGWCGISYFVGA